MKKNNTIYIAEPDRFSSEAITILRSAGAVVISSLDNDPHDAIAMFVRLGRYVDESVLCSFPKLRFIVSPTTGHDHIDEEYCDAQGIEVLSLRGDTEFLKTVHATIEYTFALMFAILRNLPAATNDVCDGNWNRDAFRGQELHGKVLGILGMGRIGAQVAIIARAFGMQVIYYDPYVSDGNGAVESIKISSMVDLFKSADILSIHVPYNESTKGLVDRTLLDHLKSGAVIVNTARGGIVDQTYLIDMVLSQRIFGAALDVLEGEPTPFAGNSEAFMAIQGCPRLIVTPHIGGATHESMAKTEIHLAKKLVSKLIVMSE